MNVKWNIVHEAGQGMVREGGEGGGELQFDAPTHHYGISSQSFLPPLTLPMSSKRGAPDSPVPGSPISESPIPISPFFFIMYIYVLVFPIHSMPFRP